VHIRSDDREALDSSFFSRLQDRTIPARRSRRRRLGVLFEFVRPQFGVEAGLSTRVRLGRRSACILCYHVGMNQQAESRQYTIRGIPREVDRALRQKAAQRKQSLNQVILDELAMATVGHQQRADFSDLVGRWVPDPAFDEILSAQRQIDWDKWK